MHPTNAQTTENIKIAIEKLLDEIRIASTKALDPELTGTQQQTQYEQIQQQKLQFIQKLLSYVDKKELDRKLAVFYRDALLTITYEIDKAATRQDFGLYQPQSSPLPQEFVVSEQMVAVKSGKTVASANKGGWARLKSTGKLVYYKNTIPKVAELEIFAAELFRQVLGRTHTSYGKIVVTPETDKRGKKVGKITGMYTVAIPGLMSMRELTELAKNPKAQTIIDSKIAEFDKRISEIEKELSEQKSSTNVTQLLAELQAAEKNRLVYTQILNQKLITFEKQQLNIDQTPLSKIIAKALCSAFFHEDWDRHKDNFGISFGPDGLDVASLDYDRSLTGTNAGKTFHGQTWYGADNNKIFDETWEITPEKLRDFPAIGVCWYWPTQADPTKSLRSSFSEEAGQKMYSAEEAEQYQRLKDNPEFQQQSHKEWLKLIFIPQQLRQDAANRLTTETVLQKIPVIFEKKRQKLLKSLICLKSFRDHLNTNPKLLEEVRDELLKNLTPTECEIVEAAWKDTAKDITTQINLINSRVELLQKNPDYQELITAIEKAGISSVLLTEPFEKNIKLLDDNRQSLQKNGPEELLKIIERTGAFSVLLDESFQKKLSRAFDFKKGESSIAVRDKLQKEFNIHVTEEEATAIKQEVYRNRIKQALPNTFDAIQGNSKNISTTYTYKTTIEAIEELELAIAKYKTSYQQKDLNQIIQCLRNLGMSTGSIDNSALQKNIQYDLPVVPKPTESTAIPMPTEALVQTRPPKTSAEGLEQQEETRQKLEQLKAQELQKAKEKLEKEAQEYAAFENSLTTESSALQQLESNLDAAIDNNNAFVETALPKLETVKDIDAQTKPLLKKMGELHQESDTTVTKHLKTLHELQTKLNTQIEDPENLLGSKHKENLADLLEKVNTAVNSVTNTIQPKVKKLGETTGSLQEHSAKRQETLEANEYRRKTNKLIGQANDNMLALKNGISTYRKDRLDGFIGMIRINWAKFKYYIGYLNDTRKSRDVRLGEHEEKVSSQTNILDQLNIKGPVKTLQKEKERYETTKLRVKTATEQTDQVKKAVQQEAEEEYELGVKAPKL